MFADVPERSFEGSNFKKTAFVPFFNGASIRLRVLDHKAHTVEKHFINRSKISVMCLGEEACPICENNRRLVQANPNVKRNTIAGLIYRQTRFMANVFNRTMVKTTPSGKIVYPINNKFASADATTGEVLIDIEAKAVNQVQVLERGSTLFSQLNLVHNSVVDEVGQPLGLWTYDISISVVGSGKDMVTNVTALSHLNDGVEVPDEDRYDLETVGIRLAPDEMVRALEGVTLRDIFAARKQEDTETLAKEAEVVSDEVKASVANVFDA